jgi:hypothetical protein
MSKALPVTPQEIADAAIGAAEAGAAIVHLHARNPETGQPDQSPEGFAPFLKVIKQRSGAVINLTTGGAPYMRVEERVQPAKTYAPEVASLNMGSMNFGLFGMLKRFKDFKHDWEPAMLGNKDIVFRNSYQDIEYVLRAMAETGTRFDGYGYFVDYNGVSDGNGTTYQGAALYGVATIEDADGQRLVAAGGAVQVEGDSAETHVAVLQIDDGFALQGELAAGTWLADSESPELVLNGAEVASLGVRYLVVRGRLVGEAFDAVIFDDLMGVSGAVEGACTTEPAAASLLDGEGRWLDILFDGTTLEGTGGDPDRCDGCGGVWFQGLYLGEVCPDLGVLTDWSGAPWR